MYAYDDVLQRKKLEGTANCRIPLSLLKPHVGIGLSGLHGLAPDGMSGGRYIPFQMSFLTHCKALIIDPPSQDKSAPCNDVICMIMRS